MVKKPHKVPEKRYHFGFAVNKEEFERLQKYHDAIRYRVAMKREIIPLKHFQLYEHILKYYIEKEKILLEE